MSSLSPGLPVSTPVTATTSLLLMPTSSHSLSHADDDNVTSVGGANHTLLQEELESGEISYWALLLLVSMSIAVVMASSIQFFMLR